MPVGHDGGQACPPYDRELGGQECPPYGEMVSLPETGITSIRSPPSPDCKRTKVSRFQRQPGDQAHILALTIGAVDPDCPTAGVFGVDTHTDADIPIKSRDYVEAWSPDGSPLVLRNAMNNENGSDEGPATLTTVTKLTDQALFFTFLGFIRSA